MYTKYKQEPYAEPKFIYKLNYSIEKNNLTKYVQECEFWFWDCKYIPPHLTF